MWSSAALLVFLRLLAVQQVVVMRLVVMQLVMPQRRQRARSPTVAAILRERQLPSATRTDKNLSWATSPSSRFPSRSAWVPSKAPSFTMRKEGLFASVAQLCLVGVEFLTIFCENW